MNKLDLLRLAEQQDVEAFDERDFEEDTPNKTQKYKEQYTEFYNDVKQSSNYIKEDW